MGHSSDVETLGKRWSISSCQTNVVLCSNSRVFSCLQDYPGAKTISRMSNVVTDRVFSYPPNGDSVAIRTVNLWVRPASTYYNCIAHCLLACISLMPNGPQRARLPIPSTATLPSCLWSLRIFSSLPGSRLTIFYRDSSSAFL